MHSSTDTHAPTREPAGISEPPDHPTPTEAEAHFRGLLRREGLAQPDRVDYDREADELIFLWDKEKLAVVIELSDGVPVGVRGG